MVDGVFESSGSLLIVLLALGTAFYIPWARAADAMQGIYSFNSLAVNLILEGLVRLGGAFVW